MRSAERLSLVLSLFVVVWVAWSEDLAWIPFAVIALGIIIVLVSLRWPVGGLVVLVVATAVSHSYFEFHGWKARPDHLVSFLLLLVLAIRMLLGWFRPFPASKLDYLLGAYLLMNYVSSILTSPAPFLSLRWALLTTIAVLPYFLIRWLCTNHEYVRRLFSTVVVVGALSSVYGLSCFLLNRVFGTTMGVEVDKYGPGIPAPFGTLYDSNSFGIYAATCSVMLLSLYLFGEKARRRRYAGTFLLALLATAASLARAVLLALTIAVLFVGFVAMKQKVLSGWRLFRLGVLVCAGISLASLIAGSHLGARIGLIDWSNPSADSSLVGRIVEDSLAISYIGQHPVIGNGTGSFHVLFNVADYPFLFSSFAGQSYNFVDVENVTLRVLHDTGVVGFLLLATFFVSIGREARGFITGPQKEGLPIVVGLAAAVLLEAVAFQFSDDSLLAFGWTHVGLLVSALKFFDGPLRVTAPSLLDARLSDGRRAVRPVP